MPEAHEKSKSKRLLGKGVKITVADSLLLQCKLQMLEADPVLIY